jgi:hypothetical protein
LDARMLVTANANIAAAIPRSTFLPNMYDQTYSMIRPTRFAEPQFPTRRSA